MNNRNTRLGRKGSLTVEVAICLPILLTVLFGGFELARANMILHSTESAAYEGARAGIIPGATAEKIEDSASVLLRAVGINNFKIKVTPKEIDESTETVKVEVTVPYRENTSFPAFFMTDPKFHGECQLNREIIR